MDNLSPTELEQLLNLPALAAPSDTIPIFNDPPNRNTMALAVVGICTTLSALAVLVRVISRVFYIKKFYMEDGKLYSSLMIDYFL